jgi:hypothetical protein
VPYPLSHDWERVRVEIFQTNLMSMTFKEATGVRYEQATL